MKITKPPKQVSFPDLERNVLSFWKKDQTFKASLRKNPKSKRFTFYDGPPFATGRPHYGHLLQGTIKDIIPRFKTMQGYYVERRFGWDCHGLPVEYELEKELGIKSRQEILAMGVDKFNEACRSIVRRYTKEWEKTTTRIGRWIDFRNDYQTMDRDYMESIWCVVKTLHEKKLLFEGRKAMHICPRCATPLSNFEVTLNYRDRQDPSVYVEFPLAETPESALLVWTTTPWTLPGNVLLAVNPRLSYVEVAHRGKHYLLAQDRVTETFGDDWKKVRNVSAKELLGKRYEPPFPERDLRGKHYEIVGSDAVSGDEGTGVLHVAPAFGEEDLAIGEKEKAAFLQPVDITGKFTGASRYRGLDVLKANPKVISDVKKEGRLLRHETVTHSYPHCWRCDTPLLNYATSSWFVAVTKLKQKLLTENKHIDWVPAHVKDGRFGKWLEGARDWAISRQRFWGNPIPIWRCGKHHLVVVGSLDELEKLSGKRPKDLHKHFVDKITFPCPECDGEMKRVEDVLDCWFESGSMPYAEKHYPFEHKSDFKSQFPADFIAEALDQTRGWFYTLHVLGVALMNSRAFQSVVTTGLVLGEDGKKMSKSLKNYPEPEALFERYGADATRLYMVTSPIVRGDDLRFAESGVAETFRNFNLTLWNTYTFFATYAAIDDWRPKRRTKTPAHLLDKWIISRTHTLIKEVTASLESYDLMTGARSLADFLDELSNWYVRRSRRRFWKSEDDQDKQEAYLTLYEALLTFCKLSAPFTPFLAEHLYQHLTGERSVHLADWPKANTQRINRELERTMAATRQVVRLGLAARTTAGLKVRQPLPEVKVVEHVSRGLGKNKEIVQIIAEELNVKSVEFVTDETTFVKRIIQPLPKIIGPLLGNRAQAVITALKQGKYNVSAKGIKVAGIVLPKEAIRISYEPGERFVVEQAPELVVGLSTELSEALVGEGRAREIIRHFQELRKKAGLDVSDRVRATFTTTDPDILRAFDRSHDLITEEILAQPLEQTEPRGKNIAAVSIDGKPVTLGIEKAD